MEKHAQLKRAVVLCTLILALPPTAWTRVIYVDDDAPGLNDGSSWPNAYRYLQDALVDATDSQSPVEIRVAQGVYKPNQVSITSSPFMSGRGASFTLADNVAIKGGFAGVRAPDPNARDITSYKSILSGDLAGDDVPVRHPRDLLTEPTRADNSIAVVRAEACSRSAVLDGFTITSGSAMGVDSRAVGGSGLYAYGPGKSKSCRPSIRNCTFVDHLGGGGAVKISAAAPEIINCTFAGNASIAAGGAISVFTHSYVSEGQVEIKGCTFLDNHAEDTAGAIHVWPGDAWIMIEDSVFVRNSARTGGALYNDGRTSVLNCLFIHNVAEHAGGVVYFEGAGLHISSCTLSGNVAPHGAGIVRLEPSSGWSIRSARIANTILWNGGEEISTSEQVVLNVAYSNIQDGWPGEGNIDMNPLFAAPGYWDPNGTPDDPNDDFWVDGDYHLKSQAGRWDPNSLTWVIDDVTSPCIDAGDPNSPVGDEPEPNGGRINMGAYGGTAEASKSYSGEADLQADIVGGIDPIPFPHR